MTSVNKQLLLPLHWMSNPDSGSLLDIDTAFPLEQANALAAIESYNKHLYRPNTYLHKWWARRSGTTFRHILKQLAEQPEKRDYYAPGGLEGKIILDPMMGGGTIIHEAVRLGAKVVGFDLDPIPYLQARASLTWLPLEEKIQVFAGFYRSLREKLAPFWTTTCPDCSQPAETQFVLYGMRKRCNCGEALFVDSLLLRIESNGARIEIDPDTGRIGKPETHTGTARPLVFEKRQKVCPVCQQTFQEILDIPYAQRYRPLFIVGECKKHGLFFKNFDTPDQMLIDQAQEYVQSQIVLPLAELSVRGGPKSNDLRKRNILSYADLYSARQLIFIATAKTLLDQVEPHHRGWLSLLVSTALELNSLLCGYKGVDVNRAGAIRHVFSHHAYSFPYAALENNPLFSGNTSGTLGLLFKDRIEAAQRWAETPVERKQSGGQWLKVKIQGEIDSGNLVTDYAGLVAADKAVFVAQQDSTHMPLPAQSVDYVVTDPPYYDSVQYSDLADFFRVWLRWFLPDSADWNYQISKSAAVESSAEGRKYYEVMAQIWTECHRVLNPAGQLIFSFHHWRPDAWAYLTLSLKAANFRLVNAVVILSENPISVHIRQLQALKHDAILVLQPFRPGVTVNDYPLIEKITSKDSYTFCQECADLLGHCLSQEYSEAEILQVWKRALEG